MNWKNDYEFCVCKDEIAGGHTIIKVRIPAAASRLKNPSDGLTEIQHKK
jgi:hypothetical protein